MIKILIGKQMPHICSGSSPQPTANRQTAGQLTLHASASKIWYLIRFRFLMKIWGSRFSSNISGNLQNDICVWNLIFFKFALTDSQTYILVFYTYFISLMIVCRAHPILDGQNFSGAFGQTSKLILCRSPIWKYGRATFQSVSHF